MPLASTGDGLEPDRGGGPPSAQTGGRSRWPRIAWLSRGDLPQPVRWLHPAGSTPSDELDRVDPPVAGLRLVNERMGALEPLAQGPLR